MWKQEVTANVRRLGCLKASPGTEVWFIAGGGGLRSQD